MTAGKPPNNNHENPRVLLIDGDRYIWPHVMEEVTRALPDFLRINSRSSGFPA